MSGVKSIDQTLEWCRALESHFSIMWKQKLIPVDSTHTFILAEGSWLELIHPEIRPAVESLNIRFHSRTNPKSSQLLALNLFLLGQKCGDGFFQALFCNPSLGNAQTSFEWIDHSNPLRQGGNPSNHDVLVDCGNQKYLVEMKFTEHSDAPCGSSKRNDECSKPASDLQCPLETHYDTRYYSLLRDKSSPYDIEKLGRLSKDCPFLHGEQYQLMRYILLCHAKSTPLETWTPVIILPGGNQFMDEEARRTKSCLKNPQTLKVIYLEEAIGTMRMFNADYASWLAERYLIS